MVRAGLQELMASTGLRVDLDARVGDLSVGDRQRLEILKALYRGAKVLILDEPTAVLTPQETRAAVRGARARCARRARPIILITHKLKEVMRLCDRVTVMRAGRVVHEAAIAETSLAQLAEAMVGPQGATSAGRRERRRRSAGDVRAARPRASTVRDAMRVTRLHGVDLALRAGRDRRRRRRRRATARASCSRCSSGLRAPQAGTLTLGGETFAPGRWLDPRTARAPAASPTCPKTATRARW